VNDLYHAALEIQEFCQSRKWQFCFIGGLALLRWGDPRQTRDADLVLLTRFENEENYVSELLSHFTSRKANPLEFAMQARVVLLQTSKGIPIDISLGGLGFEENLIKRSSYFEYLPQVHLVTASADDLIVMKSFADRTKDWADIENILIRQGNNLNWDQILRELKPLCELKEAPEIVDRLIQLRNQLAAE
jgi:hypothetical protein